MELHLCNHIMYVLNNLQLMKEALVLHDLVNKDCTNYHESYISIMHLTCTCNIHGMASVVFTCTAI